MVSVNDALDEIKKIIVVLTNKELPEKFGYGSIVLKKSGSSVWVCIEIDFKVDRNFLDQVLEFAVNSKFDGKVSFESLNNPLALVRIEAEINSDYFSKSRIKSFL